MSDVDKRGIDRIKKVLSFFGGDSSTGNKYFTLKSETIGTDNFRKLLAGTFSPIAREYGFEGAGFYYNRLIADHYIHILEFQVSKWGGSCCVEMCVHIDFLPTSSGKERHPKHLKAVDCEIRRRLAPKGKSGFWWGYGSNEREALESIKDIINTFKTEGLSFFEHFNNFPKPFDAITIKDLEEEGFRFRYGLEYAIPNIRLVLMLARIHLYIGDKIKAREFSEYGLNNIGNATSPLTPLFEEIIAKC